MAEIIDEPAWKTIAHNVYDLLYRPNFRHWY